MVLGLDWNTPILNRVGPRHDTIKCVMLAGSDRDTIKWVMSKARPLGTTYFAIYSPVPPPSLFSILQAWIKRERKLHPISLTPHTSSPVVCTSLLAISPHRRPTSLGQYPRCTARHSRIHVVRPQGRAAVHLDPREAHR